MSWKGFTKSLNRAGTTLMQKANQIEKSDDPEFQQYSEQTKTLETHTKALQKEAKAYLDAMRGASMHSRLPRGCRI